MVLMDADKNSFIINGSDPFDRKIDFEPEHYTSCSDDSC